MAIFRKKDKELVDDATDIARSLTQMYQAGFFDGLNLHLTKKEKYKWKDLKDICKKAFDKRFVTKIKEVKKNGNRNRKQSK